MKMSSHLKPKTPDGRNLIDFYWYWKNEDIIADLDKKRLPFSVLCCNIHGDYNLSCVIRSSNAFLAEKVYIYGKKKWDCRGAVGAHKYQHVVHIPEGNLEAFTELNNYTLVGVDNIAGATPVEDFVWPTNPLLCFGEEQLGLPAEILDKVKSLVYIRQYGTVRSLNVATAAGIVMQDFAVKHSRKNI